MNAAELLKISHAYLRGAVINDSTGVYTIDRDTLAREINLYLNEVCNARNVEQQPEQLKLDFGTTDSNEGGTCA